MAKTANQNNKRRAQWQREGKCLACGGPKPCDCSERRRKKLVSEALWCDECICGGGLHRADCTRRKKAS